MLVNPRFSYDPVMTQINNILGGGKKTEKIKDGMFLCPHFNFGNTIGNEKEEWFDFPRDGDGEWLNAFGVSDTIEQVEEKYAKFLSDPELKFCVSFTPVKKAEQPPEGGVEVAQVGTVHRDQGAAMRVHP